MGASPASGDTEDVEPSAAIVNEVAAIGVDGATIWLGTPEGVVLLDPDTQRWRLVAGDEAVSHDGVTGLSVAPDGTVWTSHEVRDAEPAQASGAAAPATAATAASGPSAPGAPRVGPRHGGVRSFHPGATAYSAWFAEDGLGTDDVAAIAAGPGLVAAAAGPALAVLSAKDAKPVFRRLLDEQQRHLRLQDLATGAERRDVVQFRPRGETVTAVAVDGASILAGTTDAIYRLDGDALTRVVAPCSVRGRLAERVVALAPLGAGGGGFVATLGLPGPLGESRPGGLVRVERNGFAWRCDVPGVDVPDAPAHAVATFGDVVYVATWEGLTRVQGPDAELFARGDGTPVEAPMSVCSDGRGGAWVGTWGGGAFHVSGRKVDVYRLERGGLVRHEAMALGT